MGELKLPDPMNRRHLIEQEMDDRRAEAIAAAYESEGRFEEAIIFWEKAGNREKLQMLRKRAVRTGDAFLLRSVCRSMEKVPREEEWRELLEAAQKLGKGLYAIEAERELKQLS